MAGARDALGQRAVDLELLGTRPVARRHQRARRSGPSRRRRRRCASAPGPRPASHSAPEEAVPSVAAATAVSSRAGTSTTSRASAASSSTRAVMRRSCSPRLALQPALVGDVADHAERRRRARRPGCCSGWKKVSSTRPWCSQLDHEASRRPARAAAGARPRGRRRRPRIRSAPTSWPGTQPERGQSRALRHRAHAAGVEGVDDRGCRAQPGGRRNGQGLHAMLPPVRESREGWASSHGSRRTGCGARRSTLAVVLSARRGGSGAGGLGTVGGESSECRAGGG